MTGEPPELAVTKSEEWKANHVRESQYLLQLVSCTDIACCSPFESSYLNVIKERFLPPLPVTRSSGNGLEWARKDKDATSLSLFQNITLKSSLFPKHAGRKFPKGTPYDYSCPAVKNDLEKRICPRCGIYFGIIKQMTLHYSYCRAQGSSNVVPESAPPPVIKVRPQRVAARCGGEVLCAMAMQELEWHAIEDIDYDDLDDSPDVLEDIDSIWNEED